MIEYLSPREIDELSSLAGAGEAWPRLILEAFADGSRLRLGWDEARGEGSLAAFVQAGGRAALREGLERAARWCAGHGLHLLSYEDTEIREGTPSERCWFMAVG